MDANQHFIDWPGIYQNLPRIDWKAIRQTGTPRFIIDWSTLIWHIDPSSPSIAWTVYDYDLMKARRGQMRDEIIREIYNPRRIAQWIEAGNDAETYRTDLVEDNIF